MNVKSLLLTAAVALVVVVAFEHNKDRLPALKRAA